VSGKAAPKAPEQKESEDSQRAKSMSHCECPFRTALVKLELWRSGWMDRKHNDTGKNPMTGAERHACFSCLIAKIRTTS
jgi:hypothetical protein